MADDLEHITANELIEILRQLPDEQRNLEVYLEGCDCEGGASGQVKIGNTPPDRLPSEPEHRLLLRRGSRRG